MSLCSNNFIICAKSFVMHESKISQTNKKNNTMDLNKMGVN